MSPRVAVRPLLVAFVGFPAALLLAAPATKAPPTAQAAAAEESRTVSVIVYGNDPCPTGTNGEIVVCARQPEGERYRIPKRFRHRKDETAPNNAWGNKVRGTEDSSRTAAGLPDTCSAVGSGGQSGCFAHFQSDMAAQRREQKQDDADVPGGSPQ